jgi:hypothetical protein
VDRFSFKFRFDHKYVYYSWKKYETSLLFNDAHSNTKAFITPNERTPMYGESRMQKESVVAYLNVLSHCFSRQTKENHERTLRVSGFEIGNRIRYTGSRRLITQQLCLQKTNVYVNNVVRDRIISQPKNQ